MDVPSDDDGVRCDQVRKILVDWFHTKQTTAIRFTENTNPEKDPYARYAVAYEAVFEPSDLEKARLEIWVTTEGMVAAGIETRNRIAERLGVRGGKYKVFAAGHEPAEVSEAGLLALLTVVADGKIGISATCLPIVGIVRSKAVLLPDTDRFLESHGYDARWLTVVDDFESDAFRHVLRFTRW